MSGAAAVPGGRLPRAQLPPTLGCDECPGMCRSGGKRMLRRPLLRKAPRRALRYGGSRPILYSEPHLYLAAVYLVIAVRTQLLGFAKLSLELGRVPHRVFFVCLDAFGKPAAVRSQIERFEQKSECIGVGHVASYLSPEG